METIDITDGDSNGVQSNGISETTEDESNDLTFPVFNVPEKLIIVLDRANNELCTNFELNGNRLTPLDMLKYSLCIFTDNKLTINPLTQFALVTLNEGDVTWKQDFTNNLYAFRKSLEDVTDCEIEDKINLNLLFDTILGHVDVPKYDESAKVPPPYIVRVIIMYNRSYTIPELEFTPKIVELLFSPYFVFDICLNQECADIDNNVSKICDVFHGFNKTEFNYIFSNDRNAKNVLNSFAKLLGHPLQRMKQKNIDFTVYERQETNDE